MNNSINSTTSNVLNCYTVHCDFLSTEERYAIISSLLIIAAVSLVGNVLVCCAFLCSSQKNSTLTVANFHLAIANLMMAILCVPSITIYMYIVGEWTLGPVMCKLLAFTQEAGITASLLHLLVVTVEKYMAVCFPFTFRTKCKLVYRYSLAIVWLIAIGESAYYAQFKGVQAFGGNIEYCMEDWSRHEKTLRIITWTKTLFFFLTLATIMILLGITIFELRFGHGNFRPETRGRDESSWSRKRARQARAVKILVVMLLSVLVCWTPFHALSIVDITDRTVDIHPRTLHIVYAVSLVLFFTVCTIHPIIFLFLNQKGREMMQNGLRKISCSSKRNGNGTARRGRSSSALESSTHLFTSRRSSAGPPPNRAAICESRL